VPTRRCCFSRRPLPFSSHRDFFSLSLAADVFPPFRPRDAAQPRRRLRFGSFPVVAHQRYEMFLWHSNSKRSPDLLHPARLLSSGFGKTPSLLGTLPCPARSSKLESRDVPSPTADRKIVFFHSLLGAAGSHSVRSFPRTRSRSFRPKVRSPTSPVGLHPYQT